MTACSHRPAFDAVRPPGGSEPIVTRPRLLERLDGAQRLTIIRAPAGFGKTTLAAQWLHTHPDARAAPAWIRLARGADRETLRSAVSDALANERPRRLIVDGLDDVVGAGLDRELLELLRAEPGLGLIVCLRSHRLLPSRQTTDLDVAVIAAAELEFTRDETARVARALGADLNAALIDSVHADAGGWPAITRLALNAAIDRRPATAADVRRLVDAVTADYVEHVRRRAAVPEARLEFARRAALLEEVDPEIASALPGTGGAAATPDQLDGLVSDGLLLPPVANDAPGYRWPPAARRVLLGQLPARDRDRLPQLQAAVARAYARRGEPAAALEHALQAEDWALAIELVDSSWRVLLTGHRPTLYAAVTLAPLPAVLRSRRASAMRDVMLQLPAADMLSIDDLPRSAAALDALGDAAGVADTLDTAFAILVAFRNCAPLEVVRDYAVRVLRLAGAAHRSRPAEVATLYPSVLSHIGVALMYAGDLEEAVEPLQEAYQRAADSPFDYLPRETTSKLAAIHALRGDLRRTSVWLARHDTAPTSTSWITELIDPVPVTARLLIALDRLELADAAEHGASLVRSVLPERGWGLQVYALAILALHDGTADDALDQLDEVRRRRLRRVPELVGAPLLAAAEADLFVAVGRPGPAARILRGPHAASPHLRVAQARWALLTGDDRAALRLAADPLWERGAGVRQRHEMQLIRAVAAGRTGDPETAVHALRRAAEAARTTGAIRPFATVPRAELREVAKDVPAALELLDGPPLGDHPELFPARLEVITLTKREQLVLEKLAAGLTLRETAAELVVSYNTVRTQQASIYRRLHVDSREDAIARAREHGLL